MGCSLISSGSWWEPPGRSALGFGGWEGCRNREKPLAGQGGTSLPSWASGGHRAPGPRPALIPGGSHVIQPPRARDCAEVLATLHGPRLHPSASRKNWARPPDHWRSGCPASSPPLRPASQGSCQLTPLGVISHACPQILGWPQRNPGWLMSAPRGTLGWGLQLSRQVWTPPREDCKGPGPEPPLTGPGPTGGPRGQRPGHSTLTAHPAPSSTSTGPQDPVTGILHHRARSSQKGG